ncbi:hypothetical protein [Phormidesmis priestleyi]|uniref:hypothetical protein n=1 Tax=Phormidesmis priestleyi TaxID=268141 RepID=UPI0012E8305F|nr:hypothetical protein [Phormidesmis priestleyi]
MMYHKILGLLALSLLLPGVVLSAQSPGQAIIVQGGTNRVVLFGDGSKRSSVQTPGSFVQLNPQPLPPDSSVQLNPQPSPPGGLVELNPQPLPPGRSPPGSFVQLNPQPEPPGITDSGLK